jgi:hypothetical protein
VIALPDIGCWVTPSCLACPWFECVYVMDAERRQWFRAAVQAIRAFLAGPDRLLPTD